MKKVKYIILGAVMAIFTAPAVAQTGVQNDPVMEQVSTILKSGAADTGKQIAALAKQYKKDANAQVSIGKAYLAQKDYANAKVYAQKAIDLLAGKPGNATPFILMGNIAVGEDNGGTAAQMFQQAIYFDPKNPDGYRRYAQIMSKTDPNGAVQTLEDLRQNCPDYPVDLIAAEIQSEAGHIEKANEYYARVSLDKMKDYQISDYATNLFLSQKYEKSLEVATAGHAKFPRNASFNRLIMFNQVEAKNYEAACVAGNDLVHNSDSLKMSAFDYGYYGRALEGAKKYEEAIAIYVQMQDDANSKTEDKVNGNKLISDCYKKISNYDKAAEYLQKFIQAQEKTSFGLEETVAQLYSDQLKDESSSAEVKKAAYDKADAIYAALVEKYPDNAAYVAMKRATMPFSLAIDQKEQLNLAGPHYVTLTEVLGPKADRSAGETKILKDALDTSIAYYVHCLEDMDKAKDAANKLIELAPENANAKAILGVQ